MVTKKKFVNASNEEYLVIKAKEALKAGKPVSAKSWMITAKTLYPNNVGVQFEAYLIEKSAKNVKEAAKCFAAVFKKFQDDTELWAEVQAITAALRSDSGEPETEFLRDMFGHIPSDIQRQLLLMTAERSEDTMEHCRLVLLLLNRFPEAVTLHGSRLVDTLLTAEKHCHYQNSVNCYRKLLVCDVLPLLGPSQVDIQPKQLLRLLHKSIEFFFFYLAAPSQAIENLPESESRIEDPWQCLFQILELTGRKLRWEVNCAVFSQTSNKDVWWQTLHEPTPGASDDHVLYCAVTCFLHCLHEYKSQLGGEVPLALVELFGEREPAEPPAKRAKVEDDSPIVTVDKDAASPGVVKSFLMAVRCWSLLHRSDAMEKEFLKLSRQLKLDNWVTDFLTDATLYDGTTTEVPRMPETGNTAALRRNLRLISVNFACDSYGPMAEYIFQAVALIPALTHAGSASAPAASRSKRHLHFMPLARAPVLQYCVRMLIEALKKFQVTSQSTDLCTGHILALLQLDWPLDEALACQLLEQIGRRGSFTYTMFQTYIINVDLLEEFMFLSTEQGGTITLDIIPSAQQLSQRRISTRGTDKGVKEDFKLSMRRQAARSNEPIDALIMKFVTYERESLLKVIQTG